MILYLQSLMNLKEFSVINLAPMLTIFKRGAAWNICVAYAVTIFKFLIFVEDGENTFSIGNPNTP